MKNTIKKYYCYFFKPSLSFRFFLLYISGKLLNRQKKQKSFLGLPSRCLGLADWQPNTVLSPLGTPPTVMLAAHFTISHITEFCSIQRGGGVSNILKYESYEFSLLTQFLSLGLDRHMQTLDTQPSFLGVTRSVGAQYSSKTLGVKFIFYC